MCCARCRTSQRSTPPPPPPLASLRSPLERAPSTKQRLRRFELMVRTTPPGSRARDGSKPMRQATLERANELIKIHSFVYVIISVRCVKLTRESRPKPVRIQPSAQDEQRAAQRRARVHICNVRDSIRRCDDRLARRARATLCARSGVRLLYE